MLNRQRNQRQRRQTDMKKREDKAAALPAEDNPE
jgi:hypothetical protein